MRRASRRLPVLAALALGCAALGCGGARPAADSALLVVVDTLRADHLGLYGYARRTSPALDAWAAGAAVFERAYSVSPWTLPAFGTLFTGRLPSHHMAGTFPRQPNGAAPGKKEFQRLSDAVPTLAQLLAGQGLATGAILCNAFLHPRFGLDRGFDTYDFIPCGPRDIRRADAAVDAALGWLGEHGERPFFLVLHLFDPHVVYEPPEGFRGLFARWLEERDDRVSDLKEIRGRLRRGEPLDREFLAAAYDEEIAFVDQQLGRLFRSLDERGLGDRLLVVVTSDHGEEFFDHGGFEHGHTIYDELLRVPLLLGGPGVRRGRHGSPVGLADLFPTLLEGLGYAPPAGLAGTSLWPLLGGAGGPDAEPRLLVAERTLYGPERRAAVRWPLKLAQDVRRGQLTLHDLAVDPGERRDLAAERPDQAAALLAELEAALAGGPGRSEAAELDDATVESLRALGYLD